MQTILRDIHTARVFIPAATGYTSTHRTFGINACGYSKGWYNDWKRFGNMVDDITHLRSFYAILRAAYGVEFSYPMVNPYVQYVDYLKSIGGGFSADNKSVIRHLQQYCNTLIITDEKELDYLKYLHSYYTMMFHNAELPVCCLRVPPRFAALQKKHR